MKENYRIARRFAPLILLAALGGLAGCPTDPVPTPKSYLLSAGVTKAKDDSSMEAWIFCFEGSEQLPITDPDATVTVNGEVVGPFIIGYGSSTLAPVSVGSNVTLHFAYDTVDVTHTLTMPAKPATVVAGETQPFDPASDITITWDPITPVPSEIDVSVGGFYTVSGDSYAATLTGSSTSHTIPGGTLVSDPFGVTVVVSSMNTFLSTGKPNLSTFIYMVGNDAEVEIDTNPP